MTPHSTLRGMIRGTLNYRRERADELRWRSLSDGMLDLAATNALISDVVRASQPYMVGRPGGTEGRLVAEYIRKRWGTGSPWPTGTYSRWVLNRAPDWSGIVGDGGEDFDLFATIYLRAILSSDALFISDVAPSIFPWARSLKKAGCPIGNLSDLNPYRALKKKIDPWTNSLAGKRVLIVHPFEVSIRNQFARKESISGVREVLPDFELDVVKPPVTFAKENQSANWLEQFRAVSQEISKRDFEVMIVGAGGYGLPLAELAKSLGKVGIHLGGELQTLFGIRGRRFEEISSIAVHIDDSWVTPTPSETPNHATVVEGGSYW